MAPEIPASAKALKERSSDLSLEQIGHNNSGVTILAVFLWGAALAFLALEYKGEPFYAPIKIFIYLFIAFLVILTIVIAVQDVNVNTFKQVFEPQLEASNLIFKSISFFLLFGLFWFTSIAFAFRSILAFIFFAASSVAIFSVFKEKRKYYQKLKFNYRHFGNSQITIHNTGKLRLGQELQLTFSNERLNNKKIDVILRNTFEGRRKTKSKNGANKTEKPLNAHFIALYEQKQQFVCSKAARLNFFISDENTFETRFINRTQYWELEFFNDELDYYARFILDVRR